MNLSTVIALKGNLDQAISMQKVDLEIIIRLFLQLLKRPLDLTTSI